MDLKRLKVLAESVGPDSDQLSGITSSTIELLKGLRFWFLDMATPMMWLEKAMTSIDCDQIYRDIDILIRSGCLADSEILIAGLLMANPGSGEAIAKLAELYELQSDYLLTVQFATQLLTDQAFNVEAAYQLSFALYRLGRSDEALEYILPYYISSPSQRISRLCGLLLKDLGRLEDAIDVLATVIENNKSDIHSIRALSEIYVDAGMYQKALDVLHVIPEELVDLQSRLYEAIIYRFMGETERSIEIHLELIKENPGFIDALWPQCFNYSIADSIYSEDLLRTSKQYWEQSGYLDRSQGKSAVISHPFISGRRLHIAFLTSDIGEHVVSRFLSPLLRGYNKNEFEVTLLSTVRRFEQKGLDIAAHAERAISLQEYTLAESRSQIEQLNLDVILDTNGFTKNSGLPIIASRCAPIQCHYIGYHATTGLESIDYFMGDAVTAPPEFQLQYIETLVQIPHLWMAYDPATVFPAATAKMKRDCPVLGAYSQITKINELTLQYWSAAMRASPESILVIKDRGVQCNTSRERIERTMEAFGVDPSRIYLIGPVGTHLDHLDSYNAIDIALDTTPWSGATTAFEALGMGVPLATICGDKTSSRMSTSVVRAAGFNHLVATSIDEFSLIVEKLCSNYVEIRRNKFKMQEQVRSGILFDQARICKDFFETISKIARRTA